METRSTFRHEQQQLKAKKSSPKRSRHPLVVIWGIVLVTLLMLSLILNQTILNVRFVNHEITRSNLSSVLIKTVNNNLAEYGVSTTLSDKETNKLVTQAVDQIYSGKEINLNLQPVIGNVDSAASQAAARYGLSTEIPNSVTSGVSDEISTTINGQLNTPQVKQLTSIISIAKVVDHVVMVVSIIGLGIMFLFALFRRNFVRLFSWIGLWSSLIVYVLILGLGEIITQIGENYPDFSSLTAQVGMDFHSQALNWWLILLVVTIILFIWRIVTGTVKRR